MESILITRSQVGINTESPKATLDVVIDDDISTPDGLLIPRLTMSELNGRDDTYGPEQHGIMIYITDVDTEPTSSKAEGITSPGFYFFNSKVAQWRQLGSAAALNIYNADGSLTGNRTVDLDSRNLVFSNTGNVGIGASSPTNKLHISGSDPLRLEQLNKGNETDNLLVVDPEGVVKNIGPVADIIGNADNSNIYNTDGSLTGNRTVDLNSKNLVFSNTGNVGIGASSPTNKLHISGSDPLRLEQLTAGNEDSDKLVVIDSKGIIKSIGTISDIISNFGTPSPSLFELASPITNFLATANLGEKQKVPMSPIKNEINGLTLSADGTVITFPPGTYQLSFIYEALHDTDGTISSYLVDFPTDGSSARIHSTAAHDTGQFSNHGGVITFVTSLSKTKDWTIALGRGQSGDCTGEGMTLFEKSTQLLIYRLGN